MTYDKEKKDLYWQIAGLENELKQYKDIEDELGIDLVTLFKALKNGIYYTNYGHGTINYCDKPKLIPCYVYTYFSNGQVKREIYGYDFVVSKKGLTISVKTYKKYWALTKEELEWTINF